MRGGDRGAFPDALAEAGLTDVHLLPVFDLATVPEVGCVTPAVAADGPAGETAQAAVMAVAAKDCFNWGYDPLHYSAPEGSFASDANDGAARVREFRAMVQGLHAIGLQVDELLVARDVPVERRGRHAHPGRDSAQGEILALVEQRCRDGHDLVVRRLALALTTGDGRAEMGHEAPRESEW